MKKARISGQEWRRVLLNKVEWRRSDPYREIEVSRPIQLDESAIVNGERKRWHIFKPGSTSFLV